MKKMLIAAAVTVALSGCATNPDKIASAYVSSNEYAGDSCLQLNHAHRVNESDAEDLYRRMKSKSRVNATAGVVGALVFWPALLFMKGKDAEADAKMSELKGRKKAIEEAMSIQGC